MIAKRRAGQGEAGRFVQSAAAHTGPDCLLWPFGRSSDGYGNYLGRLAHRAVYELAVGAPPSPDLVAAHAPGICHNRLCVNPGHLRWATRVENTADQLEDGTRVRGERNGHARLTADQVLTIRADGRRLAAIAADYGITASAVSRIRNRKAWAHVGPKSGGGA